MLLTEDAGDTRRAVVVGDLMTDVVVRLREDVAPESDTASQITIGPGGSASNVAVFLARDGIATTLVGAVGDDERGRSLVDALTREGVAPQVRVVEHDRTGSVVSMVGRDGRRSMLTDRGANLALDAALLPDDHFRARCHLHLSGYELIDEATRSEAKAVFDRAGVAGMSRSVDCSSAAPLRRMGARAFFDVTVGADVLFANGDEAQALAGSSDPEAIIAVLTLRYATSIVTLGSRGVCLIERDAPPLLVPARAVRTVDTTGAGDAFTGAFLAATLRDAGPRSAIDAGLDAAAMTVQVQGARPLR